MHLRCRCSEQWLRHTIRAWLAPTRRSVSTSSAINRGLAASDRARSPPRRDLRHKRLSPHGTASRPREGGQGMLERRQRRRGTPAPDGGYARTALPGQQRPASSLDEAPADEVIVLLQRLRHVNPDRAQAWLNFYVAKLKDAVAQANKSPSRLAELRSTLDPQNAERWADVPGGSLVVQGRNPPAVDRVRLWLRPDSTFEVLVPSQLAAKLTPPAAKGDPRGATPGLAAAIKRLAHLIHEVQRPEVFDPNLPFPATQLEEARFVAKYCSQMIRAGKWGVDHQMTIIQERMDDEGRLWDRQNTPRSKTYVHVRTDGILTVVTPQDSKGAPTSNDRTARAPERGATQRAEPKELDADGDDNVPVTVPYTTAASTFLYGSNAVLAALRARRRKLYHVYLHPRILSRESNAAEIRRLAKDLGLRITTNADLKLLDKMSDDRPHNGVVLEASNLPVPPVLALGKPDRRTAIVPLLLDRQSAEDIAVNGAPGALPTLTRTWRHPFILMLDGITDPGNVGNILRTAHFYGVDAVAVAKNTCAPLTSAALAKASSGACEALRILSLPRPADFAHDSVKAGWHVYAAVAPQDQRPVELRRPRDYQRNMTTDHVAKASPLARHPVILMLGAEGEGLRGNLRNKADHFVTIGQGTRALDLQESEDVGVDSLNVGVAAGVLVDAFMRKPEGAGLMSVSGELGF